LWTLSAGGTGSSGSGTDVADADADSEDSGPDDEDESSGKSGKVSGYTLEYDAARKIAQGLGAHLEGLTSLVEVKGDKATLLPVIARTRKLFGKEEVNESTSSGAKVGKGKPRQKQMDMFVTLEQLEIEEAQEVASVADKTPAPGTTVLDRVHQAMILFSAGRSEAMKRFLVDDGIGNDPRFWGLAQAFSALYPSNSEEKRWVDGILARKKGLGF
jgi:putative DNA methylase